MGYRRCHVKQPMPTHAEPVLSTVIEMIPVGGDVLDHAVCAHCRAVIVRQYPDGEWLHVVRNGGVPECPTSKGAA